MGPTWVLSAPDGPHIGPINLAIRDTGVWYSKEYPSHSHPTFYFYLLLKSVTLSSVWKRQINLVTHSLLKSVPKGQAVCIDFICCDLLMIIECWPVDPYQSISSPSMSVKQSSTLDLLWLSSDQNHDAMGLQCIGKLPGHLTHWPLGDVVIFFRSVIPEHMLWIKSMSPCDIALRWVP